jgi:hypothetical protein
LSQPWGQAHPDGHDPIDHELHRIGREQYAEHAREHGISGAPERPRDRLAETKQSMQSRQTASTIAMMMASLAP